MNTKIKKIKELNEQVEKRYIIERLQKIMINEGLGDRLKANTVGLFNRFVTFGENIGIFFTGGSLLNSNMEAAYARVRNRAKNLQKELEEIEVDLDKLYEQATKTKIENRIKKLEKTSRGEDLELRYDKLEEALTNYYDAIAQLKGINEGFIKTVKRA